MCLLVNRIHQRLSDFEVAGDRRSLLLILALLIVPANVPSKEKVGDHRVSAASHMAKEVSTLGIHRIYVPDFCDDPSRLNDRGAFFAAMFSMLLAK
jgi:hypothetical protein